MDDNSKHPANKADLRELQSQLTAQLQRAESRITQRIERVIDQLNRGFRLSEESIRTDSAHVDDVAAMDVRLRRIEVHLGLEAD